MSRLFKLEKNTKNERKETTLKRMYICTTEGAIKRYHIEINPLYEIKIQINPTKILICFKHNNKLSSFEIEIKIVEKI